MKKRTGKVYLIGAGPGDPGLLTVKGKKCLGICEVIIYDALVNPEILTWANPSAVKIYAGKRGVSKNKGRGLGQDQINRLMTRHAMFGKMVARLKGGDPFLFGRGGEEAEFLSSHSIPFEVVPGVSSLTAVPAYAGIPVTDRRHNSMLTVITGHSRDDTYEGPGIDWGKISPSGTLVIFMGVEQLASIIRKLLREGWPKNLPIACVRWGTMPEQRTVSGTLSNILKKLKFAKPKFSPPAVIVIGSVVNIRKKIGWFKT